MGATSVPQVLARLPGIQTLTHGDVARVYIRGADAYMTSLFVDGVRVFSQDGVSGIGGGVPWELIPVSQIDHIEVLRGPASAIYGSDAMGGVVHIFTRKGEAGLSTFREPGHRQPWHVKDGGGGQWRAERVGLHSGVWGTGAPMASIPVPILYASRARKARSSNLPAFGWATKSKLVIAGAHIIAEHG